MKNRKYLLIILSIFALLTQPVTQVRAQANPLPADTTIPPEGIIVRFRPGIEVNAPGMAQRLKAAGVVDLTPINEVQDLFRAALASGQSAQKSIAMLSAVSEILYAEPDYQAQPIFTPNDSLFGSQWALGKIRAEDAWDSGVGSSSVVIAVIDSGIDLTHPDLTGQLWYNPGEVSGTPGVDDDNSGFVDDFYGWNFVTGTNGLADTTGHGTQVAGVIAAKGNNNEGIAGLCWECRIMPLVVTASSGVTNYSDIVRAVNYAALKGASVINISLGGYSDSRSLKDAIDSALARGIVVVAGVGNDARNDPFYPAAYPGVISVASVDSSDQHSSFTNVGSWVSVSAPGEGIQTTFSGGGYGSGAGTSLSTGLVSGLVGLVRSQYPGWNGPIVRNQIVQTVESVDSANPGYEGLLGTGRINAARALMQPQPLLVLESTAVNGDPLGQPEPGQLTRLSVTLRNDWYEARNVVGLLSTSDPKVTLVSNVTSFRDIASSGQATGLTGFSFTTTPDIGYSHPIPFQLLVTAEGGYSTTIDFIITVRSADQPFCGTITVDTTWTSNYTYLINCNVGVAPGKTLTIQPGTVVKFMGNYSLSVGGTLIADGTESQPIQFVGNTGVTWGRIFLDDTSADAVTTAEGVYQSGNILRWVSIKGASQGIACTAVTPYLERVTSDGGGVNCQAGATQVWVKDSSITGDVTIAEGGALSLVTGHWTMRNNMPNPRYNAGGALAADGRIYIIGGAWGEYASSVESYDPVSNSWLVHQGLLTPREELGVAGTSNGDVFAIGGDLDGWGYENVVNTVEVYHPQLDVWEPGASLNIPRRDMGVAVVNDKIYVIGGANSSGVLGSVEVYDPALESWELLSDSDMPTPREYVSAAVYQDKIFVIGGQNSSGQIVTTVEVFDPETREWDTSIANFNISRIVSRSAVAGNGKLYVIGGRPGWDGCGDAMTAVEEYDPETKQWSTRGGMLNPRAGFVAVSAENGKIYVFGGDQVCAPPLNLVEEYTPPDAQYQYAYHLLNAEIAGNISVPEFVRIQNVVVAGSLQVGTGSIVSGVEIAGEIMFSGGGIVENTTAGGPIHLGSGTVKNSSSGGGINLSSGTVQDNTVSNGGISIGSGEVLTNTITGGGISASAPVTITGNSIENAPDWGIVVSGGSGEVTVTGNRLVGNANGINTTTGTISGNLIANSAGTGLEIGSATVQNNTFTGNGGSALKITSGVPLSIDHNNFEFNSGSYDIENQVLAASLATLLAADNWWGTTDTGEIAARVYDYYDYYNLGEVNFEPVLSSPDATAPAYVRSVTLDPPSPVGIETVQFDVQFSRPMDSNILPQIKFGYEGYTWENTSNIPTPISNPGVVTTSDGKMYVLDGGLFYEFSPDTGMWVSKTGPTIPRSIAVELALVGNTIYAIGGENNGEVLSSVEKYDRATDQWSPVASMNTARYGGFGAVVTQDGKIYVFGGLDGNSILNEAEVYDPSNDTWTPISSMPTRRRSTTGVLANGKIYSVSGFNDIDGQYSGTIEEYDPDTSTWTTKNGLSVARSDASAAVYNNKIYVFGGVYGIGLDSVEEYDPITDSSKNIPGLPLPNCCSGAAEYQGKIYVFGGMDINGSNMNTVNVFVFPFEMIAQNPQWSSPERLIASYDITSQIPRDTYTITVQDAVGQDGIEIAPNSNNTFTVDYAGSINDTTPSPAPEVSACSGTVVGSLAASWYTTDSESPIDLYRYAIGTSPGGAEVINWINTPDDSVVRTGLALETGQSYYVNVQARNGGGLWSDIGSSPAVEAGSGGCVLTGSVQDDAGSPIAGASISAGGGVSAETTGTDGLFTFSTLAPGSYTITPSLAGYSFTPNQLTVDVPYAGPDLNFTGTLLRFAITGTVTDGTNPIAGVTVSAGGGISATTGTNGQYTLANLLPGEYTLTPTLAGYSFAPVSRAVTLGLADEGGVDFTGTLLRFSITGTVTDGTNPIAGVTVSAGAGISATTDVDGQYTLANLLPGEYTLTPALAGYSFAPVSRVVTLGLADEGGVNFTGTLLRFSITGTVTDGIDPIAGVSISAGAGITAITGADGQYTLANLLPGEYTVTPTLAGYAFAPISRAVTLGLADEGGVDFTGTLLRFAITGTVTDGSDPIAGVTVSAEAGISAATDVDGQYTLANLLPGEYTLTPTLAGYSFAPVSRAVTLGLTDEGGVDFTGTLVRYAITGTVTDGSNPIAGVTVSAGAGITATTGADGQYTLANLLPGEYTLTPTLAGYSFAPVSRAVTLGLADEGGVNFTGTLLRYSITGTVTDGSNPIAGVTVSAGAGITATTGANGQYTLANLLPGEYTVTPTLAGYSFVPVSRAVTLGLADEGGVNFTGTLLRFSITGTVTDGIDPIAGVSISAGAGITAITGADGQYTLANLLPGEYTVTPTLAGYAFAPISRAVTLGLADEAGVDFTGTLLRYSITGTVTDGSNPIAGVLISTNIGLNTITNTDGFYVIEGISPGSLPIIVYLTARKDGYDFLPSPQMVVIAHSNQAGVDFTGTLLRFSITGTVTDGTDPIAGVTVSGGAGVTAITGANGQYTLANLLPGEYTLTPTLAGYSFAPVSRAVTLGLADEGGVDFTGTLLRFSITGTVTDGLVPIAGVSVSAGAGVTAITDAEGQYTLANLLPGEYTVTPALAGYSFEPILRVVTLGLADETGVDFTGTLLRYAITGTVTDGTNPIAGVTVSAGGGITATTGADGQFTIANLLPGEYTVTPTLAGYSFVPVSRAVTLGLADEGGVNFTGTLLRFAITGTVTDGTNPIAGVSISAGAGISATTGADGQYTLANLLPGEYTLTPTLAGYTFAPISKLIILGLGDVEGQDFTGRLITFSVSGKVTDRAGKPLVDVEVSAGVQSGNTLSLIWIDFTDENGDFNLDLVPGVYTLTFSKEGYTFQSRIVTVIGATVTDVDVMGNLVTSRVYIPFMRSPIE